MAGDEESVGDRYHFKAVDGPASTAVVEAVAFVTGRDPLDLGQLGRIIDADALDGLLESADRASVTFEMEGLTVQAHAAGDILVEDPGGLAPSLGRLAGSNVLLLDRPRSASPCAGHPHANDLRGATVLAVSFSPPDASRLDAWFSDAGTPANAAMIGVGDFARSSTASVSATSPRDRAAPVVVETVADPTDLASLEARIADRLAELGGLGDRTVVCFDSVTALLEAAGIGRGLEFLRAVTDQTSAAAASAHFHLDAERYDGEVAEAASALFDAVVTVDENGEWVGESGPGR